MSAKKTIGIFRDKNRIYKSDLIFNSIIGRGTYGTNSSCLPLCKKNIC